MGAVRYGELITSIDLARLDLFGIDYIGQYIGQEIRREHDINRYCYYLTDCLKAIAENTARFNGGTVLKYSYREIVETAHNAEPQKTAEEVIDQIKNKLKKL